MSQKGLCGQTNPFITYESSLGAISEWTLSQFSLTVYELTGAVGADESIRHLCKEFRGLFLTRHRVSFI
jgi:hypothetical protein